MSRSRSAVTPSSDFCHSAWLAFDYSGNLIAQTPLSAAGGFVGLVADTEISQAHVVNTFNYDIKFRIWDLQFKEEPVSLRIQSIHPGETVSWPATAQNYTLEGAAQLASTGWQAVTNSRVILSNELAVLVEATAGHGYYRLHRQ